MSVFISLLIGFVLGVVFVVRKDDVVLINRNVDGSKWVKHDGKKYSLFLEAGGK